MLTPALIQTIQALYNDPRRGYHAWSHPQALLGFLAEVRDQLHDPLAVECAILLHDAVYDPRRGDNEQRSAALAKVLLADVLPRVTLARTIRLIEATERHEIPHDMPEADADDARIFLDLDLSVFGAPEDVFDVYEAGVRHEYSHVRDADFRNGRAAILTGFLARDRLFLSDWGRTRFEPKARANLRRSVEALRRP